MNLSVVRMSLKKFHGRWKEVGSKNDVQFYEQMGLGRIGMFLMTKVVKRDMEILVKDEKAYEYIEGSIFRSREEVTLGVEHFRSTIMGKIKSVVNVEGNAMVMKLEVVETNNSFFGIKLQPGTTIDIRGELNSDDDNMATHQMILNGVVMEKVFRRQVN